MKQNAPPENADVLQSIRLSRIIIPTILGIGVVLWMMKNQLDPTEFEQIPWNGRNFFWLGMAILTYIVRHLFYAWRIRELSSRVFSWWKSIELIFIWEFSSSVSPTSVGGSAVALFMLAQEKISTARTVSIVLYSMVLDSFYFIVSLILFYAIVGPSIIRPGMTSLSSVDEYGVIFIAVIIFMLVYGGVFAYGLFVKPQSLRSILKWLSNVRILSRFKESLSKTGDDVVITAEEMQSKPWTYHVNVFAATSGAWLMRFAALNCIIIALIPGTPMDWFSQLEILARGETMYAVTAFSPTPGGAGIAEVLFGGFFTDYISAGIATVVALVWRLITYYPYLIAGALVIPNWIGKIMSYRSEATS